MAYKNDSEILLKHGIKPTANRLLVFETMKNIGHTFSLSDMEDELLSMDKSTIFRTLVLFLESNLIHSVEDGSGSLKYCVCHNNGDCSPDEFHCHFYCEECQRTLCLEDVHTPIIDVPEGYTVREANYLLKGICSECKKISI